MESGHRAQACEKVGRENAEIKPNKCRELIVFYITVGWITIILVGELLEKGTLLMVLVKNGADWDILQSNCKAE